MSQSTVPLSLPQIHVLLPALCLPVLHPAACRYGCVSSEAEFLSPVAIPGLATKAPRSLSEVPSGGAAGAAPPAPPRPRSALAAAAAAPLGPLGCPAPGTASDLPFSSLPRRCQSGSAGAALRWSGERQRQPPGEEEEEEEEGRD